MDKNEFLARFADVIQVSATDLTGDFVLNADNWDSLVHLGVIALIDELYGVTVPTQALKDCSSVDAVIGLIEQQLEKQA